MNVTPLGDRILAARVEAEEEARGGIIIPDTAQEKTQLGKVIATGEGKCCKDGSKTALTVKKGDTVLFGKFSGTEVNLDREEYLILREDEVLGIVEK